MSKRKGSDILGKIGNFAGEMERFEVNILGCGAATPSGRHMPSAQVVNFRDRLLMVDCGEGAQLTMRRMGLKFSRLGHVFISHLHGDHVFGLPGLVATLGLHGKGGRLVIHTSAEGRDVLKPMLDYFCRDMPMETVFETFDPRDGIIYEDKGLTVEAFPLYHRVECAGFIFREKPRPATFNAEMGRFFNVPVGQIAAIKEGADFVTEDGRVIENSRLVTPARRPLSYAYCSDTRADMRVAKAVEGVDLLYHEATYHSDLSRQARDRGHSTAAEAAMIAKAAGAGRLVIGHFSKRYADESVLVADAVATGYTAVTAAREGMTIPVEERLRD